jgi:hypothetical protein
MMNHSLVSGASGGRDTYSRLGISGVALSASPKTYTFLQREANWRNRFACGRKAEKRWNPAKKTESMPCRMTVSSMLWLTASNDATDDVSGAFAPGFWAAFNV